ncbi:MAG: epoxyqueuosine reductase [Spirochaetae bacterium HGW-Spirochaetae-3]|jgi:epoxyqueuosine reductase QueG|nr:MAG: epoxyqueuosine reductase [Spirochaetae bacterium HGW-Spirochaetae-3]
MGNELAGSLTARAIKEFAYGSGCDLCGIASVDRFLDMPAMSNPGEILRGARSVIVVAKKFLRSSIRSASAIPYTIIRNGLSRAVDEITIGLAGAIEDRGYAAIPTGAIEPCNYDEETGRTMGLISLKNAARQAGLGVIGKNTLLITPEYGNMVWLGAVITSLSLEPDRLLEDGPCNEACRMCIDSCPVGAIDGSAFMRQGTCWEYAFGREGGGEWRIKCHACRTACPYSNGYDRA